MKPPIIPFCTIEPNVGIVEVPDPRLTELCKIVNPQRVQPAIVEFVDIAGLVAGASKGEGLGNQFLANIRETDAIVNVVRCFDDDNIVHVAGKVDPIADIETIGTELALADLTTVEKAIQRDGKKPRAATKTPSSWWPCGKNPRPPRPRPAGAQHGLDDEQQALIKPFCLLTIKPAMYVANVAEDGFSNNPFLDRLTEFASKENAPVVAVCAAIESENRRPGRRRQTRVSRQPGPGRTGLNRLIRAGYELLGLQTYFTAGVKKSRLDHPQRRHRPASRRRDPHRLRTRLYPRANHRLCRLHRLRRRSQGQRSRQNALGRQGVCGARRRCDEFLV